MDKRKNRYFIADFETTVYEGQTSTEVWASACVEMYTEDVLIFHSIREQFDYFVSLNSNLIVYYHNLKFDGSFWLAFLMQDLKYKQAQRKVGEEDTDVEWIDDKYMSSKTFKYSISELGAWYNIKIKVGKHFIEIRDSLKLLPFSVKRIGKSFKTKHQKLEMEYNGLRWAGCEITDKEREYIANDVLVVKEAMEIMFNEGNNKLTIGACCLAEYKKIARETLRHNVRGGSLENPFDNYFPNMYNIEIDKSQYGYDTADAYIRRSYHGGWCYLVKGKENKKYKNGTTADVNSLYPSMMSGESGNRYPFGEPHFWKGNTIPDEAISDNKYYFVRIKTRFYIKDGMLPFIQIKNSLLYNGTEALETSDVYDNKTHQYYTHYKDRNGNICDTRVELVMTMTDYILFREHYNVEDFEILDGCWFWAEVGLFDGYINKYKEKKLKSKDALRELAKLFLNNLYGKFAASSDSSYKIAYVKDNGIIGFSMVHEEEKTPGYIPVGSAITSYSRNFTIRAAQKNYYGANKRGFIYADTDSIHCDLKPEEIKGITVHDKNFCCWKLEASWDTGFFTRQKTYIEHVVAENLEPIEEPYYNIKCAGMPDRCKELFKLSMQGNADINGYKDMDGNIKPWNDREKAFLFDPVTNKPIVRTIKDFTNGLEIPGSLKAVRIKGGIILKDGNYKMS